MSEPRLVILPGPAPRQARVRNKKATLRACPLSRQLHPASTTSHVLGEVPGKQAVRDSGYQSLGSVEEGQKKKKKKKQMNITRGRTKNTMCVVVLFV